MTEPDGLSRVTAMRAALMELGNITGPILEAVTGYKAQCRDAGFGEKAADEMATAYHAEVLRIVFSHVGKAVK